MLYVQTYFWYVCRHDTRPLNLDHLGDVLSGLLRKMYLYSPGSTGAVSEWPGAHMEHSRVALTSHFLFY